MDGFIEILINWDHLVIDLFPYSETVFYENEQIWAFKMGDQ